MSLLLGIDTGGTYTDAVLFDDISNRVSAKAKALTSHQDLTLGINNAISKVLGAHAAGDVSLVSVSTTLATNALVEGIRQRVCVVLIGLQDMKAIRPDLAIALEDDLVLHLHGGHDSAGMALTGLELEVLEQFLQSQAGQITGFAITSYFATRNPEHELACKAMIERYSALPISCSHELAFALNAPKRALTCLLNARLVGMMAAFIQAVEDALETQQIQAPLLIVKGDGSLMAASEAKQHPIETVYSGPAASLVGACHLSKLQDAVIADIGGTTTDLAILKGGQAQLSKTGVRIANWHTLVKAVDMKTFGLGGDSEIRLQRNGLESHLKLGPRRVMPVSLLALSQPELVHQSLDRQLLRDHPEAHDGLFLVALSASTEGLGGLETEILSQLQAGPQSYASIATSRRQQTVVARLLAAKLLLQASFNPSDAAHVLGHYDTWDKQAASKAAQLFARQRNALGEAIADDAEQLCQQVIEQLSVNSADIILDTVFAHDGLGADFHSQNAVIRASLAAPKGNVSLQLRLQLPIIGLGASAHRYYPQVGQHLATQSIIPEHAEVANAIGAVTGLVRACVEVTVDQPSPGTFRCHSPEGIQDFHDLAEALQFAEALATRLAQAKARLSTSSPLKTKLTRIDKRPLINGEEVFLASSISATSFARASL